MQLLTYAQIIGAPAFFPTVWGWIKRWFDPVTVSKIFILGKHEMKATLENFIDPKDFPEQYGGKLKWNFGDLPHMDEDALRAVEKDGHKGWVPGPCLWLEHERVIVGSEKGKLRRADTEVAQKKPVVYAADYTEEPVHPERKASVVGRNSLAREKPQLMAKAKSMANGTAGTPHEETKAGVAAGGLTAATAAKIASQPKAPQQETQPKYDENVRTAPFEGSPVRVSPLPQPGHPAVTAEYLSSDEQLAPKNATNPTPQTGITPETLDQSVTTAPAETIATSESTSRTEPETTPAAPSTTPATTVPPSMPQPGPISDHQQQIHAAIANKMDGESVSVLPEESGANGGLAHPEITTVSDPTKGLAIETEKLALADTNGRPAMDDRFQTAAQF
jgi:CRAL/TRIO domain